MSRFGWKEGDVSIRLGKVGGVPAKAAFTPGEWQLFENRERDEWPCDIVAIEPDDDLDGKASAIRQSIVEGAVFVDEDPAVNIANQRLMVAAPKLYRALRDLADEFAQPNPLSDLRKQRINAAWTAIDEADNGVKPDPADTGDDGGQADAAERAFLDGEGGLGGGRYPDPNEP